MTEQLTPVHIVSLGCARNEVDSEELAGRLEQGGFRLVADPAEAEAVLVNTCGFIEQAKKDSIDEVLAASDLKDQGKTKAVIAVGCMAERYGKELADQLPEADAVLGFDSYADIASKVGAILSGHAPQSHTPVDRRTLLPIAPVRRRDSELIEGSAPAGFGGQITRRRLSNAPSAPIKLASGCDRRCAFCAIPRFRGAYLSRERHEVVEETNWLAQHGVREAFLVSENTSSYGKDLGDLQALERILPELAAIDDLSWIRVSYLQPAEVRPTLIHTMLSTAKVAPYFDLSFQHASGPLLRRMRRFGDAQNFLTLIAQIRELNPYVGIRSNFIVGFPGETDDDIEILKSFMADARLDAIGVFAYSDEENTEGALLDGHLDPDVIQHRYDEVSDLAELLCAERALERICETVDVLVESIDDGVIGRAGHQGPEVDGTVVLVDAEDAQVGDIIRAVVVDADGIDLIAKVK
ncbi:MAG: 30S ribosomal protein S12 methylthiotransferase RimO [Propionibacteriaceae bacterium]